MTITNAQQLTIDMTRNAARSAVQIADAMLESKHGGNRARGPLLAASRSAKDILAIVGKYAVVDGRHLVELDSHALSELEIEASNGAFWANQAMMHTNRSAVGNTLAHALWSAFNGLEYASGSYRAGR